MLDPMAAVAAPHRGRPATGERTWSRDEARRFLEVADADRLAAVWRVAFSLGCRPGELCGLRWSSIDLEAGTVRIVRQVQTERAPGGGVRIREQTKTGRGRAVALDARTVEALRAPTRRSRPPSGCYSAPPTPTAVGSWPRPTGT
jgi:integrase